VRKNNLFIGSGDFNQGSNSKRVIYPNARFLNKSSMEGLILPIGIVSGSSQLTSSLDDRYIISGSVVNVNTYLDNFIIVSSGSFGG
jgi:hypothetical protein